MRIYETQRIGLDNDFLLFKGRHLEIVSKLETEQERKRELKNYSDWLRLQFEDEDGNPINNVVAHITSKTENYLVVFPEISKKNTTYSAYYDFEKEKYYIVIGECN